MSMRGRPPLPARERSGERLSPMLTENKKGPGGDARAFPSVVNGGGAYFSATALTAS